MTLTLTMTGVRRSSTAHNGGLPRETGIGLAAMGGVATCFGATDSICCGVLQCVSLVTALLCLAGISASYKP